MIEVKPCVIDTGLHYFELDEDGVLFQNGVRVGTDIAKIQQHGYLVMTWSKSMVALLQGKLKLEQETEFTRDYFNYWTSGNQDDRWLKEKFLEKPMDGQEFLATWTESYTAITIGDQVIGYATGDLKGDYKVSITDPSFMGRVTEVAEPDGRVRSRLTEGPLKRRGQRFANQFINLTGRQQMASDMMMRKLTEATKDELDAVEAMVESNLGCQMQVAGRLKHKPMLDRDSLAQSLQDRAEYESMVMPQGDRIHSKKVLEEAAAKANLSVQDYLANIAEDADLPLLDSYQYDFQVAPREVK